MFDQSVFTRQSNSPYSIPKTAPSPSKIAKRSPSGKEIFICPEESNFYSQCLDTFVLQNCLEDEAVIEFGSGDGLPVIHALLRTEFLGCIHGYELNSSACKIGNSKIAEYGLSDRYVIHNTCFFTSSKPAARYLVSNPPYLPAVDDDIYLPLLRGGTDGSTITRKLFSLGYDNVMSLVSSYSNPVDTIDYAIEQGYSVSKFLVTPLEFGYYSSEPKVKNTIAKLREQKKAFYSGNIYLLAGVLFQKQSLAAANLSDELIQIITSL